MITNPIYGGAYFRLEEFSGLRSPASTPVNINTRPIYNTVVDIRCSQYAMQPEAINKSLDNSRFTSGSFSTVAMNSVAMSPSGSRS